MQKRGSWWAKLGVWLGTSIHRIHLPHRQDVVLFLIPFPLIEAEAVMSTARADDTTACTLLFVLSHPRLNFRLILTIPPMLLYDQLVM